MAWPNASYRNAFQKHFNVASPNALGFYCRRSQPENVGNNNVRRRIFLSALPRPLVISSGEPLATLVNRATSESISIPNRVGFEHVEQVRALITQSDQFSHRWGAGWSARC